MEFGHTLFWVILLVPPLIGALAPILGLDLGGSNRVALLGDPAQNLGKTQFNTSENDYYVSTCWYKNEVSTKPWNTKPPTKYSEEEKMKKGRNKSVLHSGLENPKMNKNHSSYQSLFRMYESPVGIGT